MLSRMSQYHTRQAAALGVLPWPRLNAWSRTLRLSRAWKRERGGRWKPSAAAGGWARILGGALSKDRYPPSWLQGPLTLPPVGTPTCAQRITSSAWKRSVGGIVSPSASAVFSRVEDWRGTTRPVSSPRHLKPGVPVSGTRLSWSLRVGVMRPID